jgi:hypothetical protein
MGIFSACVRKNQEAQRGIEGVVFCVSCISRRAIGYPAETIHPPVFQRNIETMQLR